VAFALKVYFLAPIPVGDRVQVVTAQSWVTPLFGGAAHWETADQPILVDLDTGIIYCHVSFAPYIVPAPFGFRPNSGHQVAQTVEGQVTSCMLTSGGGDTSTMNTDLTIEPTPQGYRG